jgi:hypothetical protein
MSKGVDGEKDGKKKPPETLLEKREAKREKRASESVRA